jgi:hypothetical protein
MRRTKSTPPYYAAAAQNERLQARIVKLETALRALADLAHTATRPNNAHDTCRALIDIEGIARAAVQA